MLIDKSLAQSMEKKMRIFFVNKGLFDYYWLKMGIGEKGILDKVTVVFAREQV